MQYKHYHVNLFFFPFRRFSLTKHMNFTYILHMLAQYILSSLFADSIKRLNSTFSEVNSAPNTAPVSGYVHLLDHGNAIFITDNRQSYLISLEFTLYFHLKTGDRLQARVAFNPDCNSHVVVQIIEVKHVTHDNAPLIKADQSFQLSGQQINLGTSVLIPATDNLDIADKVEKIVHALPAHAVPILLSFDGRPTNFNVATACFTKPSYTAREKLMACLLTFFQAKQQADVGKDVVLMIDSLDKMFVTFNDCMQSAGTINPNLLAAAAVVDFENILVSSGNLKAGGSLTIIGLHHKGNTPQQLHITDRLYQVLDQVVEI